MTRWYLDISATAFDLQVNALAIYDQRLQSAARDCGLTVVHLPETERRVVAEAVIGGNAWLARRIGWTYDRILPGPGPRRPPS